MGHHQSTFSAFFGLISLLRTLIGLAVLCGLGALAYEVYTHYQTRENTTQSRNAGSGEGGSAATGRGLVKKPWTGEPDRGAGGADQRQSCRARRIEGARRQPPSGPALATRLSSGVYLRNES